MRANKQKDIKVPKSGYKRSKFNWSHDVNTTYNWGEIQPTQCKMLVPGSKTTMQAQNLIRLAPMVAPTFGRVKFKTYNQFVPLAEVFPNFDAMMAQEPKTTAGGTQVPLLLPYTNLGELSSLILHGARCTTYFAMDTSDGRTAEQNAAEGYYITGYRTSPSSSAPIVFSNFYTNIRSAGVLSQSGSPYYSGTSGLPNVGTRVVLDLSKILRPTDKLSSFSSSLSVVLGLTGVSQIFPVERGYAPDSRSNPSIPDYQQEVTLESADYVVEGCYAWDDSGTTKYDYVAFAFELSDSGKRLRKILQGCGYQIDFTSIESVSILPLLAQYKAYFDIFGLQLYQGWETTYCAKCIKYIENNFVTSVTSGWYNTAVTDSNQYSFLYFIFNELLNEWYSESADYIGAHMDKLAVSPPPDKSGFLSVSNIGGINTDANIYFAGGTVASPDGTSLSQNANNYIGSANGTQVHAYVNQLQHGQVDATLLMRMYRWTNRNSILGRLIAKILRAQNLGAYVDACNSNFIGSSDVLVTISDVVSTSATDDASLGEYGGRGLQYDSSGPLSFENDVYGYWITLATVVPEAGYTQGLDRTLTSLKKFDLYNPDFDAIGMELTPKNAVVATSYINGYDAYDGHNGFGFIPRYSKFKVHQNLVNGDFNRHGKRSVYLPYTLDKQLNINDFNVTWEAYAADSSGSYECGAKIQRSSRTQLLPVAGNVWRMPTKYAWLGNFNRIFLNIGKHDDDDVSTSLSQLVGFSDYNDDNFLGHAVYAVNCYAPMKPIEESYGLEEDEEPNSVGADFVSKA